MQLSIIVPVYNMAGDGKLVYCLESLLAQTITDYEVIAVDDCSSDSSLAILREYEVAYPDIIRVIASERNRKQGGAKNLGLQVAKGEWIGFIDSDDWADPTMYEKLLGKAEETGADMVACDYQLTHEQSMKQGKVIPNHTMEQTGALDVERYKRLILQSGSLVVKIYKRKNLLEQCPLFPEGIFYEDNAVSNEYVLQATNFAYVPEALYYYYQHDTSTVHTITKERCEHRMEAARLMVQYAKEKGYLDTYREEIVYKFTLLFYVNTLFSYIMQKENRSMAFLHEMGKEMRETFPDFLENTYVLEKTDKEQQRFMKLQMKSTRLMVLYYDLLQWYRNVRYGKA